MLQNGRLHNGTLQNGTLQNECHYKTVHVTKRYVTERYSYKTVTVTKQYTLQNGTLQNGMCCKTVHNKGQVTGNGTLVKSLMFLGFKMLLAALDLDIFYSLNNTFSTYE
jgi:hypothetical protein